MVGLQYSEMRKILVIVFVIVLILPVSIGTQYYYGFGAYREKFVGAVSSSGRYTGIVFIVSFVT